MKPIYAVNLAALWLHWRFRIIGALAALFLFLAWSNARAARHWEQDRDKALARAASAEQQITVALRMVKLANDAKVAADVAANAAIARSVQQEAAAKVLRTRLAAVTVVASQPGLPPSVGDTLRAREAQLALSEAANDSLTQALGAEREARRVMEFDRAKVYAVLDSTVEALKASGRVNKQLADLVKRASPPCRLLVFPCPSRTTSAVIGAVAATATIVAIRR